jgi:hypothetical protein
MNASALPTFELFGPLIFVIGAIYVMSPMLPLRPSWGAIVGIRGGVACQSAAIWNGVFSRPSCL